jgi:hypothetical protein
MSFTHYTPYYEPSGETPLKGALLYTGAGMIATCVLGVVFSLLGLLIAPVWLKLVFVLFVLFASAVGIVFAWLVKWCHLRSPFKAAMFSLIALASGMYAVCLFQNQLFSSFWGDEPYAWMIFLGESVIVSVFGIVAAFCFARHPYSEIRKQWAKTVTLPYTIGFIFDIQEARAAFEKGDFSILFKEMKKVEMPYSVLTLTYVEGDPDCYFLTIINHMKKEEDYHGNVSIKKKPVIRNVRITLEDFRRFHAHFNPPAATSAA